MEPRVTASTAIAWEILDHVRLPIFLVGSGGEVKYGNSTGQAELRAGDPLKQIDGLLTSIHASDNARLRCAIAAAGQNAERQTIILNDGRNARPHLVTILPFRAECPDRQSESLIFVQKLEP